MSDITYIGQKMKGFQSEPEFDGFSRVVIIVSEDLEYVAGSETGRTMTLECPWGTQQMADNILDSIRGFQYHPYTASGALLDPATELGDGLTANNVYGGIYSISTNFGGLCRADVSAPAEKELDHEYPYVQKQDRIIRRNKAQMISQILVQADRISAEVENRESSERELYAALTVQADRITAEVKDRQNAVNQLNSQLSIQSGQISAKVSKTGGNSSSFGWVLDDSSWTIKANSRDILKATKDGLEIYGKITATSGQIGGFAIESNYLSYNNQTWGGTNNTGIYIGPNGIQLGTRFKVDAAGNLTAASGTFTGTVHAGNIQYGDNAGYFSGGGISSGSIYGDRLVGGTITTDYTSKGINGSLGRADAAYNIVTGYTRFGTLVGSTLSADDIKLGRYSRTLGTTQITYKDGSDKTNTLNVVTWS